MGNFEYDRQCGWCQPSKYVVETTVASVHPAENSEKLDVAKFDSIGYQAVVGRNQFRVGERVVFIPGETLIPNAMAKELGIASYLSHSRVKTIRLRKNLSEGLVCSFQQVEKYREGLLKWEDQEQFVSSVGGNRRRFGKRFWNLFCPDKRPVEFTRFYEMPNLLNAPKTFAENEAIVYSEKIHGMNMRFGRLAVHYKWWAKWMKWTRGDSRIYIGSHNIVLNPKGTQVWQQVFWSLNPGYLPKDCIFFGEVYGQCNGKNIQHITYGLKEPGFKVFAIYSVKDACYLKPVEVAVLCSMYKLPCVKFHATPFKDVEGLRALANSPSELTDQHGREGIVICSENRRGVMAKLISSEYLETKNRTENKQ